MMVQGSARSTLTLVWLFALGLGSILGYTYARRDDAATAPPMEAASLSSPTSSSRPPAAPAAPATTVEAASAGAPAAALTETVAASPPPTVVKEASASKGPSDEQLRADALSPDPEKSESTLNALAKMPKERAIGVLRHVIISGDEKRRVHALHSLRTLAVDQGDSDGAVRGAIRDAIYHGDSEDVTTQAQTVLAEVEDALSAPKSRR
jgi:hypothetical protein